MNDYLLAISQWSLILLSLAILGRCLRSLLSEKNEPEVWAYIRAGRQRIPVYHWENIIGKGLSADVRVFGTGIGRTHAVLKRNDKGRWYVYDVFAKGGVWVNGIKVPQYGEELRHGDTINLGGSCVTFLDVSPAQKQKNELSRTSAGSTVNGAVTLLELTVFQAFLVLEHVMNCGAEYTLPVSLSFGTIVVLQWLIYYGMRLLGRRGFEIETLAFYLTTLGLSVAASCSPEDIYKQAILIAGSVLLFLLCGWWMRSLKRTNALRIPLAVLALGLLALNIFTADAVNGAKNWLTFAGYSFQPSEFVKALYVYVGAATLDSLYRKKNLYYFIAFSAACVVALALIGDFGTALIFFITFLVISFMRSGSIATVLLAVSGAGLAGFLAVTVKPYIARRFAIWGHVWDDIYDAGYQQTRALSAAASGGLLGKGAGVGWLKDIFASETDMVFALICEELGLIIAITMVLAIVLMAFFAVKSAKRGRSSYYAIASCATAAMLLSQLALNAFGSLDILPFTGVTFPFVSKGGSSLISCWMLMAYLKSADNRRNASFAVRPVDKIKLRDYTEDEDDDEEEFEEEPEDEEDIYEEDN